MSVFAHQNRDNQQNVICFDLWRTCQTAAERQNLLCLPIRSECGRIQAYLNQVGDCLMNRTRPLTFVVFFLSLCFMLTGFVRPLALQALQESVQYFPETGHIVRNEFLDFFNQRGGLKILGYPITEEFLYNGRLVQYFQQGRLDLYPENPPPTRVQLGPLSEELGKRTPPVSQTVPDSFVQRYFPETGHTVAYAFLSFFNNNGGLDTFGYPISEYGSESAGGRIVQYFQRAKMEWYPELAASQRVQLADLGTIHFDLLASQGKLDPALKSPVSPPAAQRTSPLSLKVNATTKYAITSRRSPQTVFVFVTDQKNMPVKGANVTFTMRTALGSKSVTLLPTDATGFTTYKFDIGNLFPGQTVFVEVRADADGVKGNDQTSFFTWF